MRVRARNLHTQTPFAPAVFYGGCVVVRERPVRSAPGLRVVLFAFRSVPLVENTAFSGRLTASNVPHILFYALFSWEIICAGAQRIHRHNRRAGARTPFCAIMRTRIPYSSGERVCTYIGRNSGRVLEYRWIGELIVCNVVSCRRHGNLWGPED